MSKSPYKIVLRHSIKPIYGQDWRMKEVIRNLNVIPLDLKNKEFNIPSDLDQVSLVISFYCDHIADLNFILSLPKQVPVIVHFQLQTSFLKEKPKEIAKRVLRRTSKAIVPAVFLKRMLQKDFKFNRAVVVRNGVDISIFHPAMKEERVAYLKNECNIPPEAFVIVYVGKLKNAKGLQILEKIADGLPPNVYMIIRSFPKNKFELENLFKINPRNIRIQVEDFANRNYNPIRYSDLLLITSLSEVAPLVSCEAFCSGVPILSTLCTPYYKELLDEGFDSPDLNTIELPEAVLGKVKDDLSLTNNIAARVASRICEKIQELAENKGYPSDYEREVLSRISISSGMSTAKMISSYKKIYKETIASWPHRV